MITHNLDLDIVPKKTRPCVELNQGDDDFRLDLTLSAHTGLFTLSSGTTAEIRGTKPNGEGYTASAVLDGNVVTVTGDANMTDATGRGTFEITLTRSGKYLSTENFYIDIEPAALVTT